MVPCVKLLADKRVAYSGYHPAAGRDGWIPVIGPEHEDRELLEFKATHFHMDVRFLSDRALANVYSPLRSHSPEQQAMTLPVSTWSDGVGAVRPLKFERAMKRKRCKREMPDFPPVGHDRRWCAMERAYVDCKLKPGNICPHRGIDLTPFVKPDGTVICPGHGLRWDTHTGDLLPYQASAA
jgi:hypothetical protein